jgi:tetratricopeptide (TPR) repeat protein
VLYGEEGRWNDSLAAARKLVELRPSDEVSYYGVAGACRELNLNSETISACNQALCINPNSFPAFEGLAWAYGEMGNYSESIDTINHAIAIKPELPYLHAWLAQAHAETGNTCEAIAEQKILAKLDLELARQVDGFIKGKQLSTNK